MCFELRNEEDVSNESTKSEEQVEQPNLVVSSTERVRKPIEMYSTPDFCSTFVLNAPNDELKSVGEAIDSAKGKLYKDAMVKELESLHKNETWNLVKFPS
jgi:hypothetical protein